MNFWGEEWGWSEHFERQLEGAAANLRPARVTEEQKGHFRLRTQAGELWGEPSGKLRQGSREGDSLWPAVGDWVLAELPKTAGSYARIETVLARRTKLSRAAAGTTTIEQIIATNIDVAFVMSSLNQDLNPRRLERYLTAVAQSGAQAVVLLSKSDLTGDSAQLNAEIEAIAPGVAVRAVSSFKHESLSVLGEWLKPGVTCVLLGSSGVGKSTLVNALSGEDRMETAAVREEDARGRHTTTYRRLWRLPSGALLIDTPGMRELLNWDSEGGISEAFEDVEDLTRSCRFSNCGHESEPGCAIRQALEDGGLTRERWDNFQKLAAEADFQHRKRDKGVQSRLKAEHRKIHRDQRRYQKAKRGETD